MSRIAQIICKFKDHKPKHFIQKQSGVRFVMKVCSRCKSHLGFYPLGKESDCALENKHGIRCPKHTKEAEYKPIFEQSEYKTYRCENQVSKYCRLIEEHPIDYKGKNVCVTCFSKLKDDEE